MAHLLGGGCGAGGLGGLGGGVVLPCFGLLLDQFGPNQMPVVRAKVAAGDSAFCDPLDGNAVLWRHRAQPLNPLVNGSSSDIKKSRKARLPIHCITCGLYFIHAQTLALLSIKHKPR